MDVFGADGAAVDPATMDWAAARPGSYRFVQRPGPDNALGRMKFMFPNEYNVYLHDTPSRDLFERERARSARAASASTTSTGSPKWCSVGPREVEAMIATGRTQTVMLDKPMAVMLLYWTEVDAEGRVTFFPDIYCRDPAVIAALAAPFRPSPRL